ncbi:hypothetical protein PSP6_60028 [Paraburkholderia tropica]|nr:hypothetical protein PSP6_60028 [Paraburkholderia tropica]
MYQVVNLEVGATLCPSMTSDLAKPGADELERHNEKERCRSNLQIQINKRCAKRCAWA